jgi:hypothetical protein
LICFDKLHCSNFTDLNVSTTYGRLGYPHFISLIEDNKSCDSGTCDFPTIMKTYIHYFAFFLFLTACKAQSPVYDISEPQDGPKNSYYKDINVDGWRIYYTQMEIRP